MAFIEWDNDHFTNIKIIDDQHIEIAETLNKLYLQLDEGNKDKITGLIKELDKLSNEHFDTEEELMQVYKISSFFSHKLEHDRVRRKIAKYKNEILENKRNLDLEFITSMKTWMFNHHKFNDSKMAKILYEEGVR